MVQDNQSFGMVAKTFQGLEPVLAEELRNLGADNVVEQNRAVTFNGDQAMLYRANYHVRTAISILKPIAEFTAKNDDDLYKEISRINWNKFMEVDDTFAVYAVTFSEIFKHSKFVSLKTKDAIADQFRRRKGKRPNVDTINPSLKINLHIADKKVTVLLDSSGEPLFKRGYRTQTNKAPLNEVLAAGMLKLAGWDGQSHLIDPMCGSGTILIEAALMAHGIAPGTYRPFFGFENWKDFDADLFEEITEETPEEKSFEYTITGSDIAPGNIKIAEGNIKQAFLSKKIQVKPANFFDTRADKSPLLMVTNPPYGERLQPDDLKIFYQKIGDKLKLDYTNSTAWLIGSNLEVMKFLGLHPDKKIKLFNGPLECSFRKFSMYSGSKKDGSAN